MQSDPFMHVVQCVYPCRFIGFWCGSHDLNDVTGYILQDLLRQKGRSGESTHRAVPCSCLLALKPVCPYYNRFVDNGASRRSRTNQGCGCQTDFIEFGTSISRKSIAFIAADSYDAIRHRVDSLVYEGGTEVAVQILIGPEEQDLEPIKRVAGDLVANPNRNYILVDDQHGEIKLPPLLVRVLMEAARQLAKGNSISILHYEQELTTQHAADLLQVSRPYLIRLLEEGKICYHLVGSHRRIRLGDLLDYKKTRDARRQANISEMARVSESLGLYDSDDFAKRKP